MWNFNDYQTTEPFPSSPVQNGPLIVTQSKGNIHKVYLTDVIDVVSDYDRLLSLLSSASEYDDIELHLNTPGGNVNIGTALITAIQQSDAVVTGVADGEVASLGTLIFLSCDQFIVNPYSTFMFHDASVGAFDKMNEVIRSIKSVDKLIRRLAKDIYSVILSHQEIEEVLSGKDLYLDGTEVMERLQANAAKLEQAERQQELPL